MSKTFLITRIYRQLKIVRMLKAIYVSNWADYDMHDVCGNSLRTNFAEKGDSPSSYMLRGNKGEIIPPLSVWLSKVSEWDEILIEAATCQARLLTFIILTRDPHEDHYHRL